MTFQDWLNENEFQHLFPFMTEEDPPDIKKMKRYKSRETYIKAMTRGGKSTENAAEEMMSRPIGYGPFGEEKILGIYPAAYILPSHIFSSGNVRPEWYVGFVHTATVRAVNPDDSYYNRPRHRLIAIWQGRDPKLTKEQVMDVHAHIIGAISWVGSYIDIAWIDHQSRGSSKEANIPSLYGAMREFVKQFGIMGLKPGDDLTSKSFRASQAKYDWKRAFGD